VKFDPALPDESVNVSGTHPVKETLVLVSGIAAVGVGLFIAIALAVDLLVPAIPPSFESRMLNATSFLLNEVPEDAVGDPRAATVSALLDRIALHWSDNPYTFHVVLLDDDVPNAMAFPGGAIVVTRGLLDRVTSENELAFVLGHELGHFRNRDHLRGLGRGLAFGLVMMALGSTGVGGTWELASVAGQLAAREFDRDQETAADAFGLALVAEEYGHVSGSVDFFEHMPEPGGEVAKKLASYLATHPLNAERIAALQATAAARGWSETGAVVPLAAP
jgi:Zn-dependent protease with chaperone function